MTTAAAIKEAVLRLYELRAYNAGHPPRSYLPGKYEAALIEAEQLGYVETREMRIVTRPIAMDADAVIGSFTTYFLTPAGRHMGEQEQQKLRDAERSAAAREATS